MFFCGGGASFSSGFSSTELFAFADLTDRISACWAANNSIKASALALMITTSDFFIELVFEFCNSTSNFLVTFADTACVLISATAFATASALAIQ